MELKEIIQGLIDSEDDVGCTDGLTVVEKKWVNLLNRYLKKMEKLDKKLTYEQYFRRDREIDAEYAFANKDFKVWEVYNSKAWETDGDRYLKVFYYKDEYGNSKKATFVVVFKKDSTKIIDTHINV